MKLKIAGYTVTISRDAGATGAAVPAEVAAALETLKEYGIAPEKNAALQQNAKKATAARSAAAKQKIQDAVNLMKREGKEISLNAVARQSGCSINTVRKYLKE